MKTIKVELRNRNALRLLKDLEMANIIKVLDTDIPSDDTKLSTQLRGGISPKRAQELNKQLDQMRSEWEERNF